MTPDERRAYQSRWRRLNRDKLSGYERKRYAERMRSVGREVEHRVCTDLVSEDPPMTIDAGAAQALLAAFWAGMPPTPQEVPEVLS